MIASDVPFWRDFAETTILPAIQAAGAIVRKGGQERQRCGHVSFSCKGDVSMDLVTKYDRLSQQCLRSMLPSQLAMLNGDVADISFQGEEDDGSEENDGSREDEGGGANEGGEKEAGGEGDVGKTAARTARLQWVVDPIDGTCNFVHGLASMFTVSVALVRVLADGTRESLVGALHSPFSSLFRAQSEDDGELWYAVKGMGHAVHVDARGNRTALSARADRPKELRECLVAVEYGAVMAQHGRDPRALGTLLRQVTSLATLPVHSIRSFGSATVNILLVALGRTDVFFEVGLQAWDVAAAVVIAGELGCHVGPVLRRQDGEGGGGEGMAEGWTIDSRQVMVCSCRHVYEQMQQLFASSPSS